MTCSKKVITDRKRDVMEMLRHFNIKIDNPLVFMEQTTMKQFIQGDSSGKYEVLMQAMNFKSLEQQYVVAIRVDCRFSQTEDNLSSMQGMLSNYKRVDLLKKRTEMKSAHEEMMKIKHLENRQQQTSDLQKRIFWAEVQEKEKEISELQKEVQTVDETMNEFKSRIESEKQKQSEWEEAINNSKTQIESLQNDIFLQQEESRKSGEEYDAAMQPVLQAREEMRDAKRKINSCHRRIEANQKKIQELTVKMQQKANDDQKKNKMKRLDDVITELNTQKEEYQQLRNEVEQNQQIAIVEIEQLKEKEVSVISDRDRLNKEVRITQMRLDDAKKAENDRRFRFGQNMVNLLNELQRYKSEYPIYCPIGDYVTLKENYKPWMNAIETTVDNALTGAVCCVRSSKDMQFLNQLGRRHKVYNFSVIAIAYEGDFEIPRMNHRTILDAFEYKNAIVRKALIANSSIESIILAKDTEEVKDITGRGRVRALPPNCTSIVTENGDTHRVKNGNPNMAANRKEAHGLLARSGDMMKKRWEAELREKTNQLQAVADRLRTLTSQMESKKREKMAFDRKVSEVTRKVQEMETQITKNRREMEHLAADDVDNEVAILRTEIDELQKEIVKDEEQQRMEESRMEGLEERVKAAEAIVKIAKQKSDEIRRKLNETTARLSKFKNANEVEDSIRRSVLVVTKANESIANLKQARDELIAKQKEKQEVVDLSVEKLGPETRITEPLNRRECEIEYKRVKEELQHEMEQLGVHSFEAVEKAWKDANAAYQKSENEYKTVKREGQQMDELNKRQKLSYQEIRHHFQQQVNMRFTMFLSQRKAEGKVEINHDSKEVMLSVKMDSTNEVTQSRVQNIRVLSGGEKSFVTLSLIMATAHIIESPFFIMDEFDVFMDEANRVVSLHTIINTAREERRQFIFITPHNLETVVKEMKGHKDISIFRLNDHQRSRSG